MPAPWVRTVRAHSRAKASREWLRYWRFCFERASIQQPKNTNSHTARELTVASYRNFFERKYSQYMPLRHHSGISANTEIIHKTSTVVVAIFIGFGQSRFITASSMVIRRERNLVALHVSSTSCCILGCESPSEPHIVAFWFPALLPKMRPSCQHLAPRR